MNKREFKKKSQEVLDELVEYIEKLESKADDIADDAKEEYEKQLKNLHEIKDNLTEKLSKYEEVTESKWSVVKDSASEFFANVSEAWKESYEKVADAFKK